MQLNFIILYIYIYIYMENLYEPFMAGAGIATDTKLTDKKITTLNNLNEHMFKDTTVSNSITKLVKATIQKTVANNANNLKTMLKQTNTIMVDATGLKEGCKVGDIIIKNIVQRNIANVEVTKKSYNKTMTDIQSDIKRNISDNFIAASKFSDIKSIGTIFGDMADSAINVAGEFSGDVSGVIQNAGGGAGIANDYSNERIRENNTDLVTRGSLTEQAEINREDMEDLSLTDELKTENIEKIVTDILAENGIVFRGLCPTNIEITDIEQINETTLNVESETINEISRTIGDKYVQNLQYVYNKMVDKTTEDTRGDIAQLGVAAAVTISSGGEAMSKTIDSSGKAVATTIDATGKAVERSFLGLGSLISQPVKYFIIGLVIVAVIFALVCLIAPDVCKSLFKSQQRRTFISRPPPRRGGLFGTSNRRTGSLLPKRSNLPNLP